MRRPDYIITKKNIPVGYIEAKDIGADLNSKSHKEQFDRYKNSLSNLIITDYLQFRLFIDGEPVTSVTIASIEKNKIVPIPANYEAFTLFIKNFCTYVGQTIKSASKLSKMMAGKARLLADIIENALHADEKLADDIAHESANNSLRDQLNSFKQILIHDITPKDFADIYAQTIAYGMFAARLHDTKLDSFTRQEAAELIPKTNPFLRKLFQYVAGYDLDDRIKWIVDALADIFRATDVAAIMNNFGKPTQQNDPVIHFYETFLSEYDPKLRKSRGVWYTPEPVVNFIVRAVDDILKTEFGLEQGLSDTTKIRIKKKVVTKATADRRSNLKEVEIEQEVHKVQILDPACGTGTFLAEIIKHVYKNFEGQHGIWSIYAEEHLIPRLYGFEILMASYAMAHLKLDLLFTDTGYRPSSGGVGGGRFRIYLTNSLEEYHPDTGTLFANWLSSEANEANHVKRDTPVMVVLGNPPYSVSSNNKSEWIEKLTADYKKDLHERNIQPLSDDYIKFIRFGEYFIEKNGGGILAYISNNSFIDGGIHRQMRKHLLETFDKIYILDLHGSAKKNETSIDGSKDENVFDIQQGVSINLLIKTNKKEKGRLAEVKHFNSFGLREEKYKALSENNLSKINWKQLECKEPYFFFVPKDFQSSGSYNAGFEISKLFNQFACGIVTARDNLLVKYSQNEIEKVKNDFITLDEISFRNKYNEHTDSRDWTYANAKKEIDNSTIQRVDYRPFDNRMILYSAKSKGVLSYPRNEIMKHMISKDNIGLLICKQQSTFDFQHVFVTKSISDKCTVSLQTKEASYHFPLYLYPETTAQQSTAQTAEPNLLTPLNLSKGETKRGKVPSFGGDLGEVTPNLLTPLNLPKGETKRGKVPSFGGDLGEVREVRTPNLNLEIVKQIAEKLGLTFTPERHCDTPTGGEAISKTDCFVPRSDDGTFAPIDILDYIYAVLHSPTYREKYKEFLKIDFPRVPYPKDKETFWALVKLGGELRQIHLLESPVVNNLITKYPQGGTNKVDKIRYVINQPQTPTYSPKGGEPANAEDENIVNDYGWQTADPKFYKVIKEERDRLKAEMTDAEKLLWENLKTKKLGVKFRRQHIIDRFIPDFVCLTHKLIIEVDGEIHKFRKEYDENRTVELNDLGYRVIRFTNEQVLTNIASVLDSISSTLKEQSTNVEVESPSFGGVGEVFINDEQYFDCVPPVAWEFFIGGYQPAQKWLKDRKGRTLTFGDILHYQKIIVALGRNFNVNGRDR